MVKNVDSKQTIGSKIGKYIKYQRVKKGYSLNELARMTDFDTSFLMRLEKGVYQSVKLDVLERLSAGFDMTLEDLLEKCGLVSAKGDKDLPSLEFYLKEKFQFPKEAISDLKLMVKVIEDKYKEEISDMKKMHTEYWRESD